MGVLLQGFFKFASNRAVPSPADGDPRVSWWWDHLAGQAKALRLAGFTAVWLPPVLKTNNGSQRGADGYGPFDDYDIGSKNQMGSTATRFGTREQLQRCVAVLRGNGLDVYLDMVEHHRIGDPGDHPFTFRYLGADGQPDKGRFPKDPTHFLPQVPRDPDLGGPASDDIPFGRELAPINGRPPRHYVMDNLIAAADWLTRALDVQGYRLDDVKGLSTDFLEPFLTSKSMQGKFAVGEFFDGSRDSIEHWITNPFGMKSRSSAFDFPLKFQLTNMCNNPGRFNMASLDHAGLVGIDPFHAVTFVENHDTDLDNNRIILNKMLGYAYILTSEGYPCVFYRDYSTDPGCFRLKPGIDNLIWIHENLAAGASQQRFLDFNLIAFERLGGPHLLVALNNDPNAPRTVTLATGFGANVPLHDYTGHSPDVVTDGSGSVTITVPQNANGLSYVCYSRSSVGDRAFVVTPQAVTQGFEGALDLDILPAMSGREVTVGRVWSAANSPIKAVLRPDQTDWTAATSIKLDVVAPDNSVLATDTFARDTPAGAVQTQAKQTGYHTLRIKAVNTPANNANPKYTLSATYTSDSLFQVEQRAAESKTTGKWSDVIPLQNVAIHAHLLPNGKVLYWGRRSKPGDTSFASLNEHECHPFLFDPTTRKSTPAALPKDKNGNLINLFCSGHSFLPDGRLMVVGGHLFDSEGIPQATIYDHEADKWSATGEMNQGRWYPTAVTLSDGTVLVASGSYATGVPKPPPNNMPTANNDTPQVWNDGAWTVRTQFVGLPLYPRLHPAPDGRIFMSGSLATSYFFDPRNHGTWIESSTRSAGQRDYCPSVLYDVGKIIYIGGGNDTGTHLPSNIVEVIDLKQNPPAWRRVEPMHFRRRQHNATLLPDGTVLVTGGSQGGGGFNDGFNDLTHGEPVRTAELWDPKTEQWTLLEDEAVDRCYHSTALLLPDGSVLSAGGGEYQPQMTVLQPNDPNDTHANAQIYSPPYMFKERPDITSAPAAIQYGHDFDIGTSQPADILKASLLRLGSVTHSFDQNQCVNFLAATTKTNAVTLKAPANANVCPPGHYLLFLLNKAMVPSVARIIRVQGQQPATPRPLALATLHVVSPVERDRAIAESATRPPVVVGLTSTCPYGLAACWGGAYTALHELTGVQTVRPIADARHSVAFVYLDHDGLPDVEKWPAEFARAANGSYGWRGVEVTLDAFVQRRGDALVAPAGPNRPAVVLAPLRQADKVQLELDNGVPRPLPEEESLAYERLARRVRGTPLGEPVKITGPLQKTDAGFVLEVRAFE